MNLRESGTVNKFRQTQYKINMHLGLMSERAVLVHEYYGHRTYRGTVLDAG
jgi:hypothetical protein